ncbi:hypothetical protein [Filimonas effusa]|uniref:Uncharacterized protein n=1 Tax=Filimonas effusa TaxID=2508721 RepID=A0A4Q1D5D2_9BACT|nr:hypothetical protein [Filimonas effusa]RXK83578.1 hypothetical protein ESB13_15935 [Filimonas effusa]
MNTPNRDLLVLTKSNTHDPGAQETEIEMLNELLVHVESIDAFSIANEIIHFPKHKIFSTPDQVKRQIVKRSLAKPFVFICNKN